MTKSLLCAMLFSLASGFALVGHAAESQQVAANGTVVVAAAPVNLNTADAETLSRELKGIGAAKAKAIVQYREAHGPFQSVDELLEVKGIGTAILEQNRERLTLN